jgi:2-polyprenyl-3-methyl-5-hydroxy-6-metoxy-1,4-benzoquinol methylase
VSIYQDKNYGLLTKRLKKKRMSVLKGLIKGSVLEVGCGYAAVFSHYRENIDSYTGVEMTHKRVKDLRKKYPEADFYKRDLDQEELKLNGKYDTILSIAVIEHLFNQKFSFNELVKHLNPGGRIIITTPTPLGNDIVHRFGSMVGLFNNNAHDDHIVVLNKKRFEILAKEFDMKIVEYKTFQLGCNQLVVLEK